MENMSSILLMGFLGSLAAGLCTSIAAIPPFNGMVGIMIGFVDMMFLDVTLG